MDVLNLDHLDRVVDMYEEGTIERHIAESARIDVYIEQIQTLIECANDKKIREAFSMTNIFKLIWKGILKLVKFLVKFILAPVLAFFGLSSWLEGGSSVVKMLGGGLANFCKMSFEPKAIAKKLMEDGGDDIVSHISSIVDTIIDFDYTGSDSEKNIKKVFKKHIDDVIIKDKDKLVGKELINGVGKSTSGILKEVVGTGTVKDSYNSAHVGSVMKRITATYDDNSDEGSSALTMATVMHNLLHAVEIFNSIIADENVKDNIFDTDDGSRTDMHKIVNTGWVAHGIIAPLVRVNEKKFGGLEHFIEDSQGSFCKHDFKSVPIISVKGSKVSSAYKDLFAIGNIVDLSDYSVTSLQKRNVIKFGYEKYMENYVNNSGSIVTAEDLSSSFESMYISGLSDRIEGSFSDGSLKQKQVVRDNEDKINDSFKDFEDKIKVMVYEIERIHNSDSETSVIGTSDLQDLGTITDIFNKVVMGVKQDVMDITKNLSSSAMYYLWYGHLTKISINQTMVLALDMVKKDFLVNPKDAPGIVKLKSKMEEETERLLKELM